MLKRRTIVQTSLGGGLLAGLAGLAAIGKERVALGPTRTAPAGGGSPGRSRATAGRPDAPGAATTTDVYVRPKLGFCGNCDTGVVTDEEVDRVTDIDLLDERFAPVREGSRIRITDLFGRARLYKYKLKNGAQRFAEGIAVSYKCDLVVAVIVGNVTDEKERKSAHRFLESNTVQVWVNRQLDGR